jgi:hypothetical protein
MEAATASCAAAGRWRCFGNLMAAASGAPGALNRVIDRGTRGINWTLSSMVFNVVPTVFEMAMVSSQLRDPIL